MNGSCLNALNHHSPDYDQIVIMPLAGLIGFKSEMIFLNQLVDTFKNEILSGHSFQCSVCGGRATSLTHALMPYLHLSRPIVFDMGHPVCTDPDALGRVGRALYVREG